MKLVLTTVIILAFGALVAHELIESKVLDSRPIDAPTDGDEAMSGASPVTRPVARPVARPEAPLELEISGNDPEDTRRAPAAVGRSGHHAGELAPTPVLITAVAVDHFGSIRGTPLGGVNVCLFRYESPEQILGSGRTDADGRATVEVPRGELKAHRGGATGVAVRLLDEGYLPQARYVRQVEGTGGATFETTVYGVRGWRQPVEVIGLLDPGVRKPVSLMKLSTPRFTASDTGGSWPSLWRDHNSLVRARGSGQFDIDVVEGEGPRWVVVDGGSGGRATAELPPRPARGTFAEPMRLELQGEGRLEGVALDIHDDPADSFHLVATFLSPRGSAGLDGSMEPLRTELLKAGEGQFQATVETGVDGSFLLEGLIPGRYRLEARVTTRADHYGNHGSRLETLGIATASAHPEPFVLRYTRPVILVRMSTGEGPKIRSLALYAAGEIGEDPWVKPDSYGWNLPVARPLETLAPPFGPSSNGVTTGHFDVEAGKQYVLVAKWPNFDRTLRTIEVPEHAPKVSVTLAAAEVPVGYLLVEAALADLDSRLVQALLGTSEEVTHDDEGSSDYAGSMGSTLGIIIEDPETGLPIQEKVWEGKSAGRHEFTCPSGPVRVVVCGLPWEEQQHGTVLGSRRHGRVERIVEVVAGRTAKVSLEVPVGGVLQVDMQGRASEFDAARVKEDVARRRAQGDYVSDEDIERMLHATLFLDDPARHLYQAVTREAFTERQSSAAGMHIINEWPLGEAHKSTMLPVGTYALRAAFPDRAPIATQVTIRAGEVTRLVLDFGG